MSNIPSIEALEGAHQFPDWYTVKIFGPGGPRFVDDCRATVHDFMDDDAERYRISSRESREGKHACVTVLGYFDDAEAVRSFYLTLLEEDDVRMLL